MSDINRTSSVSAPNYTPINSEETSATTKTQASTVTLKPQSKGIFSDFLTWLGFSKVEKADSTVRKLLGNQVKERASQYEWKPSSFFLKSSLGSENSSSSLTSTVRGSSTPRYSVSTDNANSPEVNDLVDKLIADREHYQEMLASNKNTPEVKTAYTKAVAILDKATGDIASLAKARHEAAAAVYTADLNNSMKLQKKVTDLNKQIEATKNARLTMMDIPTKAATQAKLNQLTKELGDAQKLVAEASAKAEKSNKAFTALQSPLSSDWLS
ncbi:MAG: hypothetical protein A3F67_05990 [Verrucomicrobia bacterium RIFCSPHIGHO2_12_FULL_41_10]|nr:MAG: hypothetical protein A3F67_05990 [Verrucomicrobia bacterium RIFCSPHIGHO2_12_FULL_41_10]HLB33064.1 hypothetical protein [Chthoniobacterales bacterium]